MTEFSAESNIFSFLDPVFYVLQNYGWHLLVVSVIVAFVYNKKIKPHWDSYKEHKFEKDYAAKYHKNPDLFSAHINAQQQWAEKMQEQYNKEMEEAKKKLEERVARKKQELREKLESYRSNDSYGKPSGLKSDYNPLMGGGTSSSYRPPKKSACGEGGCGK